MKRMTKLAVIIGMAGLPYSVHAGVEVAACCDSRGYCGYGVGSSWNDSYNGTRYLCRCTSGGGSCSPTNSSGSSSRGSSGGSSKSTGSSKDLWKYQMMQGIVDGMMQGFMKGLENDQRQADERAEQQRQQQEAARLEAELQRQKTEAEKKAAKEAWDKKRKDDALQQKIQKQHEVEEAAALSDKMKNGSNGLQLIPMGGTNFFGSGNKGSGELAFKPMGTGEHDASQMPALRRALCSAYFSDIARKSSNNEEARYYNAQADKVMEGEKYEEACNVSDALPEVPEAPIPNPLWTPDEMAFFKQVEEVSAQMQEKALQLQEIETKLSDNKEKIEEAKAKKEQADMIIKDLKTKAASIEDPTQKAELDTLLAEANALLSEAESTSGTVQQENEQLLGDKQKIEQSIQDTKKMLESQIPKPKTIKGEENEKR